jgi:hypothetical protein
MPSADPLAGTLFATIRCGALAEQVPVVPQAGLER